MEGTVVDESQVSARLLAVADELRDWWQSALTLRIDRNAWEELAPALTGHHSTAGTLVGGWYRDAVLIRCRRLLAAGNRREESPRRTLARLAEIAEHVTVELLTAAWLEQGTSLTAGLVREQVMEALARAERDGRSLFDVASIEADAERLREDNETVARFTSRAVAHQDRRRHTTPPPTIADVDRVIDDVLEVVQRYAAVIAGVHLDTSPPRVSLRPTVRAIELFDWPAYVEAVSDEAHRRWHASMWPPNARERVENAVEVRYVWPEVDD